MYTAISWGRRLYGAVDRMPGGYYVGTMCSHFCYLPLIPRGSMIVTGKDGDSYEGIEIPLSRKSWLVGWVQVLITGVMVLLGIMLFGLAMSSCDSDPQVKKHAAKDRVALYWVAGIEAGLGALMAATVLTPGIGRASPGRAKELAQLLAAADAEIRRQRDSVQRLRHR